MTNIRKILHRGMHVNLVDEGDLAKVTVISDCKKGTHEVLKFRDEYITVKSLSSGAIKTFYDFDLHYMKPTEQSDFATHTLQVRLELLEISPRALDEYRSTNQNDDISKEDACKKLTRNVILARQKYTDPNDERYIGKKAYNYGYLFIVVKHKPDGTKVVTFIRNDADEETQHRRKFSKDQRMYAQLNERLGIKDDHNRYYKPEVEVIHKSTPVKEEKSSLFKKFIKLFK
ncbi:hypothetical protein [Priestia megaterium]|uniref:hypothetical protein n=1 Tax=Priestia megaterium TaxID=1404 RepID=UPI0028778C5C|nr:hypothetical protein [Priestia megaterium]